MIDAVQVTTSRRPLNMAAVKEAIPILRDHLMTFWRTEISLELLVESQVAKTLKYLLDYCKSYESDLGELGSLISMCEQILQKWKNFVSNTIFDDKRDNDFIKHKR
jgi:hypothetical protein